MVSSTNKTDCHDLAEILLKVSLTIITLRVKEMLFYFLLGPSLPLSTIFLLDYGTIPTMWCALFFFILY